MRIGCQRAERHVNQDVQHFLDESEALHALVASLKAREFSRPTAFKAWTTDRILHHLQCWNRAACLSLADGPRFRAWYETTLSPRAAGTLDVFERDQCGGLTGPALVAAWRDGFRDTARAFDAVDPKTRVEWAALAMSARSSITARLMETWAHGQAIYDLMGVHRVDRDRIHGIAVLGINTFGWTFKNRGLPSPGPQPYVALIAPSGAAWTFGDTGASDRIVGPAIDFCQVVAQTRNIADTALVATGATSKAWMAIAQCFAGPPEDPPKAGTRRPSPSRQ
jgi:uncharacterized protein (TIGR03084 family)